MAGPPGRIVVMGVAGAGKTVVGAACAERLGVELVEGDELHPPSNVEAMRAGVALTDAERWPWLAAIRRELRARRDVVVTCSALKRAYRDALRAAGGVRFVELRVPEAEARRRVAGRSGHFMSPSLVASQFAALEPPAPDETDVAVVDAGAPAEEVVEAALTALGGTSPGTATAPLARWGGIDAELGPDVLDAVVELVLAEAARSAASRVLLVPPDHTRAHSRAGELAGRCYDAFRRRGVDVGVLPALGSHAPLDPEESRRLFAGLVPHDAVLRHDWRGALRELGEIAAAEVEAVSSGRFAEAVPVGVDAQLLEGWDLVVSLGQVVPHEVVGMANYTKNLVIGLGGARTVDGTHLLGALCDLESVMGRSSNPVRDVVDAAFDRFVDPAVPVLFVLTVVEDRPDGPVLRAVLAGRGGTAGSGGAAYREAAALAARVNVTVVDEPLTRVACFLDPGEFHSTWLGNKAVYRTRMALADGAELVVLAPGVVRFGEDAAVDGLVRRHGYRGTAAVRRALEHDPELRANPSAAAHLVQGSSEGRFRIVYCTDPDAGGLTEEDVVGAGYAWRPLAAELERLGVGPSTPTGPRSDADGSPFTFIARPALGLWTTADRLG